MQLERTIVPCDFSAANENAFKFAIDLANKEVCYSC